MSDDVLRDLVGGHSPRGFDWAMRLDGTTTGMREFGSLSVSPSSRVRPWQYAGPTDDQYRKPVRTMKSSDLFSTSRRKV